ncbi:FecR family protein [Paenibacillus thermotolerans]|uniref:FecR family protein n=1 Tax=Paenibacillus thermotolerans TaxID=3027807 RepID=UPI002367B66B|nr:MULTISPECIES: FecR family protein [unclassified Paenibacillus]
MNVGNLRRRLSLMSRIVCGLLIVSLVSQLFGAAFASAASESSRIAQIVSLSGEVFVKKSGGSKEFKAYKSMALNQGDYLRTGKSSSVTLKVIDHEDELTIGANASLYLSKLKDADGGKKTNVSMQSGSAYVKAGKLKDKDTFQIETPTAVMGVRGTNFMVGVDNLSGNTDVAVASGIVQAVPQALQSSGQGVPPAPPVPIYPAQQISFFANTESGKVSSAVAPINPAQLTSTMGPSVIGALLQNAAAIQSENRQLLQSLNNGQANQSLGVANNEEFAQYASDLNRLADVVATAAVRQGTLTLQQVNQIAQQSGTTINTNAAPFQLTPAQQQQAQRAQQVQQRAQQQAQQREQQILQAQQQNQLLMNQIQNAQQQQQQQNQQALNQHQQAAEQRYVSQLTPEQRRQFEQNRTNIGAPPVQTPPVQTPPSNTGGGPVTPAKPVVTLKETYSNANIGDPIEAKSDKAGTLYLVPTTTTVTVEHFEGMTRYGLGKKVSYTNPGSYIQIPTDGLSGGDYYVYAVSNGNISEHSPAVKLLFIEPSVSYLGASPVKVSAVDTWKVDINRPLDLYIVNVENLIDIGDIVMPPVSALEARQATQASNPVQLISSFLYGVSKADLDSPELGAKVYKGIVKEGVQDIPVGSLGLEPGSYVIYGVERYGNHLISLPTEPITVAETTESFDVLHGTIATPGNSKVAGDVFVKVYAASSNDDTGIFGEGHYFTAKIAANGTSAGFDIPVPSGSTSEYAIWYNLVTDSTDTTHWVRTYGTGEIATLGGGSVGVTITEGKRMSGTIKLDNWSGPYPYIGTVIAFNDGVDQIPDAANIGDVINAGIGLDYQILRGYGDEKQYSVVVPAAEDYKLIYLALPLFQDANVTPDQLSRLLESAKYNIWSYSDDAIGYVPLYDYLTGNSSYLGKLLDLSQTDQSDIDLAVPMIRQIPVLMDNYNYSPEYLLTYVDTQNVGTGAQFDFVLKDRRDGSDIELAAVESTMPMPENESYSYGSGKLFKLIPEEPIEPGVAYALFVTATWQMNSSGQTITATNYGEASFRHDLLARPVSADSIEIQWAAVPGVSEYYFDIYGYEQSVHVENQTIPEGQLFGRVVVDGADGVELGTWYDINLYDAADYDYETSGPLAYADVYLPWYGGLDVNDYGSEIGSFSGVISLYQPYDYGKVAKYELYWGDMSGHKLPGREPFWTGDNVFYGGANIHINLSALEIPEGAFTIVPSRVYGSGDTASGPAFLFNDAGSLEGEPFELTEFMSQTVTYSVYHEGDGMLNANDKIFIRFSENLYSHSESLRAIEDAFDAAFGTTGKFAASFDSDSTVSVTVNDEIAIPDPITVILPAGTVTSLSEASNSRPLKFVIKDKELSVATSFTDNEYGDIETFSFSFTDAGYKIIDATVVDTSGGSYISVTLENGLVYYIWLHDSEYGEGFFANIELSSGVVTVKPLDDVYFPIMFMYGGGSRLPFSNELHYFYIINPV